MSGSSAELRSSKTPPNDNRIVLSRVGHYPIKLFERVMQVGDKSIFMQRQELCPKRTLRVDIRSNGRLRVLFAAAIETDAP
jgi:hypothetical protein